MADLMRMLPIGPIPELFDDNWAAFANFTVKPALGDGDGLRPLMPLLSRGHHFDDERGEAWTVLRAHVHWQMIQSNGRRIPVYWYEYDAVNGRRVLR